MKLSLKNIGKIGEASVEINGITVIAGENNTGKSTVGRALFAMFNSFYHIDEKIRAEREQNVKQIILAMCLNLFNRIIIKEVQNLGKISSRIVHERERYKTDIKALKDFMVTSMIDLDKIFEPYSKDARMDEFIVRIADGLKVSDEDIFKSVLEKNLDAEFYEQINNIFLENKGEIILSIKDQKLRAIVKDNHVCCVEGKINISSEAVYMDDLFVMDQTQYYTSTEESYLEHGRHLSTKLYRENQGNLIEKIVVNHKLEKINEKISAVCNGNIFVDNRFGAVYQRKGTNKLLAAKNLSTGFKTFAILKTLLQNGTIGYQGTIILDEPEIHLHPEWQLLFAELIVLLQKEFDMHILLNTHSPYFLNAIEVYSAKYEIDDRCKYYLASSENDTSYIEDVTDNIEKIYSKLARPLQELENERYRL